MSNRNAIMSGDGWRAAKSLITLYDQVIAAYPQRALTADDATIGDTAHAARTSDHNPNSAGVVCALDLTHDPNHGFNSYDFGETLRLNRDERTKYVISNSRIFYGPRSPSHGGNEKGLWKWEPYHGDNPHDKHIHISVGDPRFYDEAEPWLITPDDSVEQPPDQKRPTLSKGSTGQDVQDVQRVVFVDGIYGPTTEQGVKEFQKAHGLAADGVVGLQTWAALLGTSGGGAPAGDWQMDITATVFGGAADRNKSAYDEHIINDTEKVASLPARLSGSRVIELRRDNKIEIVSVEDIGPWLVDDFYWQNGARPIAEDMTKPLPRGPHQGRRSNGAGIDLSPALAKSLGVDGKGKVDWRFHQTVTKEPNMVTLSSPPAGSVVQVPVESAAKSKTIWTAVITAGITLATAYGLPISEENKVLIMSIAGTVGPIIIGVIKTWFTSSITPSSAKGL